MNENRTYTLYFDSSWNRIDQYPDVERVDLAVRPDAARMLIDLGLLLREDLPCLIVRDPRGKITVMQVGVSPDEVSSIAAAKPRGEDPIVVYASFWCPDCKLAKRLLDDAERKYQEVAIDEDPVAEAKVMARSGGRRVVPTIVFGERLFAFNPPPAELKAMLRPAGEPRTSNLEQVS
ncbi:MAG TPA: glutaredoxin domain-containing protein [Thermoanaerobaculia bacterium]|nr:glutaredoxin domain-containing protein [Thermoanaerobaculia bacterium]